jgi:hypothetical protein
MSGYTDYYNQLTGAVITSYRGMEKDEFDPYDDGFPVFRAKLRNGEWVKLSISRDPEGNGGGFIFIETDKEMEQ